MKRFLPALTSLTVLLLSITPTRAESGSFIVSLKNGENVEFKLSERPKLTFPDGKLRINSSNVQSEFDLNEISKTEFTGISGIKNITATEGKNVVFDLETVPGHVLISGCKVASVYNTSGKLALTGRKGNGELIDIDMSNLQPGIYVIYTPVRSIKYLKQ